MTLKNILSQVTLLMIRQCWHLDQIEIRDGNLSSTRMTLQTIVQCTMWIAIASDHRSGFAFYAETGVFYANIKFTYDQKYNSVVNINFDLPILTTENSTHWTLTCWTIMLFTLRIPLVNRNDKKPLKPGGIKLFHAHLNLWISCADVVIG